MANYKHGGCSGWREYRYGERKRPITLAGRKPKQIVRGDRREHVVDSVAALLKTFKLTPFEHEGACLHGLRSGLCLEGHRWPLADIEATGIVAEALRRIGAERPTWDQGQREYAVPRENCRYCARPLDEEDIARNRLFCSPLCAKSFLEHRDFEDVWHHDKVGMAAYRLLQADRNPARVCEQCGKTFKTRRSVARFCSERCAGEASRTIPDRACKTCGVIFRPVKATSEFCSAECGNQGRKFREIDRMCVVCFTPFVANKADALYCSMACNIFASRVNRGKVQKISPRVWDYLMRPASGFACEAVAAD